MKTNIINKKENSCHRCSFTSFCYPHQSSKPPIQIAKQQRLYKKQQLLCSAHQPFNYLYMVKSGVLKTSMLEIEGRERIMGFYLPGEILGFEAIYRNIYPFSVVAIKDTVVCEIDYSDLMSTIKHDSKLQQGLLKLNSQRINMGACITYVRAEQRLIGFLLELAERLNGDIENGEFTLPISRQEIGNYLGLAPETVIRIINRLHEQKILLANKKHFHLDNLPKLRWLMQGGLLEDFHFNQHIS